MTSALNVSTLASALVPVLFVLLLGYWAGRHHRFDADQASGFSTLALSFALPAALFVGMTKLKRTQLGQDLPALLALLVTYLALYLVVFLMARRSKTLGKPGAAVAAILVTFPAAPVFGTAVLQPLFGTTSVGVVGLVSLVCNLTITPITLVLVARGAGQRSSPASSTQAAPAAQESTAPNSMGSVILRALASPLVWAPVLGLVWALVGLPTSALVSQTFDLLGSAASGVAIFAAGLLLAAHKITLSGQVWWISLGKLIVEPVIVLGLLLAFGGRGQTGGAALVATALPCAVLGVLLAAQHKVLQAVAATSLFVTSVAIVLILPLTTLVSSVLK